MPAKPETTAKSSRLSAMRPLLLGLDLTEIVALTQRAGFDAFRAKQIFHWIYQKGIASFEEASNLPKDYRAFLAETYEVGIPVVERVLGPPDSTQKILFTLRDGRNIEGVLMRDEGRLSLCVSTQVGCPLACQFCLTGVGGFQRNLEAGEIVGQLLAARKLLGEGELLNNMVFMGMGEPLLNFDAVVRALQLLVSPQAVGFSSRRITVSTVGIAPLMARFGEEAPDVNLAVSLNATINAVRSRLMPVNGKYPIAEVLDACRAYPLLKRRRITFEYVMLKGVNDADTDARRLAKLVRDIPCKLNLILFNPHESLPFEPSDEERVEAFGQILRDADYTVAIRHSKGRDLQAACGQLAGHVERKMAD